MSDAFPEGDEPEEGTVPPGVTSLTNPTAIRDRKRRIKDLEEERAKVLLALLATPAGRRFYAWMLHDVCGLYRTVANQAYDPHGLHYREGARAVGQILHETALKHGRQQYLVLLSENLNQG